MYCMTCRIHIRFPSRSANFLLLRNGWSLLVTLWNLILARAASSLDTGVKIRSAKWACSKTENRKEVQNKQCIKWSGQWYLHPLLQCKLPIVFLMLLHAFHIILSASKETGGVTLLPLQCLLLKSSNSFVLDPYSFHQDHLPYPLTLQQQWSISAHPLPHASYQTQN